MHGRAACTPREHVLARRSFLGGLAFGAGAAVAGIGALTRVAAAREVASKGRRVLLIFLSGGVSQLETWDPKPGAPTGGPFLSIPTTVPGLHFSELLPWTARRAHRLAVVRGVNTSEDDHGLGAYLMLHGRRQMPGQEFPHLGAVCSKAIAGDDSDLPGFVRIVPGGGGTSQDSAYLGPRHASILLADGQAPQNIAPGGSMTPLRRSRREALLHGVNDEFLLRRRSAATEAYTVSFDQAARLMERREIFDASREPPKLREHYGTHDFGRHCLLARRLLENGVTFVCVTHSNYDTHNENFEFHLEQLGEFDRTFAALIDDLAVRGMLESTLVVVLSEFGRTPAINHLLGRDHWSKSWSVVLAGCGVQAGAVIGKTSDDGSEVVDRPVNHGQLFHTYLRAVGLDSKAHFEVGGRELPLANPADEPIAELLS